MCRLALTVSSVRARPAVILSSRMGRSVSGMVHQRAHALLVETGVRACQRTGLVDRSTAGPVEATALTKNQVPHLWAGA